MSYIVNVTGNDVCLATCIPNTEYCVQCAGLCLTKLNKLQQLSQLFRRVDRILDTLSEVLIVKANYLPPPLDLPPTPPP